MHVENEKSLVVISTPKICIPRRVADQFVMMYNKFWNDVRNSLIEECGSNSIIYNERYVNSEFIPTVKQINSYSGCLSEIVEVEQIDRYIVLDNDGKFVDSETLAQMWNPVEEEEEDDK